MNGRVGEKRNPPPRSPPSNCCRRSSRSRSRARNIPTQRADAGAAHRVDRHAGVVERVQHAEVREPTGAPASEDDPAPSSAQQARHPAEVLRTSAPHVVPGRVARLGAQHRSPRRRPPREAFARPV